MTRVPRTRGMRVLPAGFVAVALAAGLMAGCARDRGRDRLAIAARVNGKAIPVAAVIPAAVPEHGGEGSDRSPHAGVRSTQQRLEAAIDEELLLQASEKLSVPDLDARTKKRIAEFSETMPRAEPGKPAPDVDPATKERIRKKVLIESYLKANGLLDPPVTEEEIAKYYAENRRRLVKPETRHVKHVLVKVAPNAPKAEADAALAKIAGIRKAIAEGRETFEEAARRQSDCSTAQTGGDLGEIQRGYMPKAFTEVAFALPDGKVSEIVQTQHGFHVMKVVGRTPEVVPKLSDVREFIARYLRNTLEHRKIAEHVAQLRSRAKIEVYVN